MISFIKHHFVPHQGNNHRPHFLRNKNMRELAGFVIVMEVLVLIGLTVGVTGSFSNTAAVLPGVLGVLTNDERASAHLTVLTENPVLNRVATLKAEDMARKSYFSHTSPEGLTPWYWFKQAGYEYEYAGENLAIDFKDSYDVTYAWMNSPTHRANIVKAAYTEVGTGVASGTYDGVPTVFVAQVYAKPAPKPTPKPTQNATPKTSVVATDLTKKSLPTATGTSPVIESRVLGAVAGTVTETMSPSFWQKIMLSPRRSANIVFGFIAFGVLLSLCIHIFVKKDSRHVDLILNGLVLVALIIAVCIVNKVLVSKTLTSFQAFDSNDTVVGSVTLQK